MRPRQPPVTVAGKGATTVEIGACHALQRAYHIFGELENAATSSVTVNRGRLRQHQRHDSAQGKNAGAMAPTRYEFSLLVAALLLIVGACLGTQTHHSGYRLPWIAGFDEQPEFHDFHHMRFNCCYGNIGWLDALHGTAALAILLLAPRLSSGQELNFHFLKSIKCLKLIQVGTMFGPTI